MIPARPHQLVTIEIDELGCVSARLEEIDDHQVRVALAVDLVQPIETLSRRQAVIDLHTVRGIYRISGTVDEPPGPDGIVTLALQGEAEITQRRHDVRVDAVRPIQLTLPSREQSVHTLNLSGGGLLAAGTEDLRVGDHLAFCLDLDEHLPLVPGEGVVVRETDEGHLGVRIEHMDARSRDLVVHFVFERQRYLRKIGRLL